MYIIASKTHPAKKQLHNVEPFMSPAAAVIWKPVEPVEQLVGELVWPFTSSGEQHLIVLPVTFKAAFFLF